MSYSLKHARFCVAFCLTLAAISGCGNKVCERCAKDSDCASQLACDQNVNACKPAKKYMCEQDCIKLNACKENGECGSKNGKCEVTSSEDCAASDSCKKVGRCTFTIATGAPECIIGNDDDCLRSDNCKIYGACNLGRYSCVSRSDNDCARSDACKLVGACINDNGNCAFSDCENSVARNLSKLQNSARNNNEATMSAIFKAAYAYYICEHVVAARNLSASDVDRYLESKMPVNTHSCRLKGDCWSSEKMEINSRIEMHSLIRQELSGNHIFVDDSTRNGIDENWVVIAAGK